MEMNDILNGLNSCDDSSSDSVSADNCYCGGQNVGPMMGAGPLIMEAADVILVVTITVDVILVVIIVVEIKADYLVECLETAQHIYSY